MKTFVLHGHSKSIQSLTYNPEGDLLFTTALDNVPLVWSPTTGALLGSYRGHKGAVWCCAVNYTSTLFATGGGDQHWRLWSVSTGESVAAVEMPTAVKAVELSHGDTHLLAVTNAQFRQTPAVNLFHLPPDPVTWKGEYVPALRIESESVIRSARFGPTNESVYFACEDGMVGVADTSTGQVVRKAQIHNGIAYRLKWDAEYSTLLSCGADSTAKLLDSRTLEVIQTYEHEKGKHVLDADLAPQAHHVLLGGGEDAQSVTNIRGSHFESRFCHKVTGKYLGGICEHFSPINAVAFHPLGRGFTTGGEDGMVRVHVFDKSYLESPGAELLKVNMGSAWETISA